MEEQELNAQEMSFELLTDSYSSRVSIEDFSLLRIIGKGSYAKVALVRMNTNNKIFAMKILKKDYIQKRKQTSRVQDERNILAEIRHPFIVQLSYAFQTEKKLYFVLEYCPGGELFNLLAKRQYLSQDQTRFYSAQIVLALEHLHSNNIVYRDLKPENVLIDRDGYIKLTDFGLSKRNISDNSGAFSLCGTPEYLAPEVIQRQGHGKAVDWWALGSIIFEMMIGIPAFYSPNREAMYERILMGEPSYPKIIDKCLRSLLEGLLQKNPAKRFAAKEVKSHDWFKGMDWDALKNKRLIAPFLPILKSETDVTYFDPEFTQISINSPKNSNVVSDSLENNFDGFSFVKSATNVDDASIFRKDKGEFEDRLSMELIEDENQSNFNNKIINEILEEYF